MRTRYKKFEHYGISEEEKGMLFELAKMQQNNELLQQACEMANISLSKWLFISLTEGVSFKGFEKKGDYILAGADDFYAYRRKAVYHFKMLLAEQIEGKQKA